MITYIVLTILAAAAVGIGVRKFLKTFQTFRGVRLLACPENRQPAAVSLGPWHAAVTGWFRAPALEVRECSRWPERAGCNQACVTEVRAAPAEHLLNQMLDEWCHDRPCVCCGTPIHRIHVGAHQPHLMDPERNIVEWKQVRPERLPEVLRSCGPVCETCLLAETHTW
jgi:hypothetical protein